MNLFRVADKNTSDRFNAIVTLLHPLPDEAQEALVDIVFKTARVVQRGDGAAKQRYTAHPAKKQGGGSREPPP